MNVLLSRAEGQLVFDALYEAVQLLKGRRCAHLRSQNPEALRVALLRFPQLLE